MMLNLYQDLITTNYYYYYY